MTKAAHRSQVPFKGCFFFSRQPLPPGAAFVVNDDAEIGGGREPVHHPERLRGVLVGQWIFEGMKYGANAARFAGPRDLDRLSHGPLTVGNAPGGASPERYLGKLQGLRSDILRSYDPIAYVHSS
jgi:hypothetical protein